MLKQRAYLAQNDVKNFLQRFDLRGPNYEETPKRVATMWSTFLNCPKPDMKTFPLRGKPGMVVVKDHVTWGFCPHHLLPIKYTFRIGYIPSKRVVGLSKLARIADWVVSTLPLQEEVAYSVVEEIEAALDPKGAGCIVHGEHHCMKVRGVKSPCAVTSSSFVSGVFLISEATRSEFLSL